MSQASQPVEISQTQPLLKQDEKPLDATQALSQPIQGSAQPMELAPAQPVSKHNDPMEPSQPQPSQVSSQLSQAQRDRIERNRQDALDRRRRLQAASSSSSMAPPTTPTKSAVCPVTPPKAALLPAGCGAGANWWDALSTFSCPAMGSPTPTKSSVQSTPAGGEVAPPANQGAERSPTPDRSRTPKARPRRQLMAMMTGSPPPMPVHLASMPILYQFQVPGEKKSA